MDPTVSTIDQFQQPVLEYVGRSPVGRIRNILQHLPILGQYFEGRRLYRLVTDYQFIFDRRCPVQPLGGTARFNIKAVNPDGTPHTYDKASTPVIAEDIGFIPDGEHEAGALVHDELYEYFFQLPAGEYQEFQNGLWVNAARVFTRNEADTILAYMAQLGGMGPVKATVEKLAVKIYPPNWGKEAEGRKLRNANAPTPA